MDLYDNAFYFALGVNASDNCTQLPAHVFADCYKTYCDNNHITTVTYFYENLYQKI